MAKRLTASEWTALLADPKQRYSLDEFSVIEQLMLREAMQLEAVSLMKTIAAASVATRSTMERIDGRLERIELYLLRKDGDYPLSQRDAPEYRQFKRLVKHYDAEKRAIAEGVEPEDV